MLLFHRRAFGIRTRVKACLGPCSTRWSPQRSENPIPISSFTVTRRIFGFTKIIQLPRNRVSFLLSSGNEVLTEAERRASAVNSIESFIHTFTVVDWCEARQGVCLELLRFREEGKSAYRALVSPLRYVSPLCTSNGSFECFPRPGGSTTKL